ncbi:tRNA (adenosine(37)-N6)-threonylcarbamoyltransferase complex transferase subunit TsaD [Buchnera aphidicola]|uniref:tRNA (adenosine(37)-N6)-threonylcarbamoyltransferase complex transferase subunit TsaD n=1 Tax=Buchnera aphidicola TaxID=9 RepID=UPI00094D1C97|nr:tRNA (adenosine(37)-N6)-threonylcarbamoyltransferase complex transferase subunit TsaD [Buchnera aphidicola]
MKILGIETSCDDTSVAIYDDQLGIIFHKTWNQTKIHSKFGGVVPELAARCHLSQLNYLIKEIFLELFNYNIKKLKNNIIDAIAYTAGPGLVSSLLVGATVGCSLAFSLGIPYIPVNHIEGHLLSPMINKKFPVFPFIALLISGGNTQLIHAVSLGQYKILGQTVDNAVGNVFDYIAKLLGLGFPGGKQLSLLAQYGIYKKYIFPRPMTKYYNLNFSFSGLQTHTEQVFYKSTKTFQEKANISRAFEEAIIDTLIIKSQYAIKKIKLNSLVVCGGVSANTTLRKKFNSVMKRNNGKIYFSEKKFSTDNAAMIAYVGYLRYKLGLYSTDLSIQVYPNWLINESNLLNIKY